jgi:hypothetical protein
MTITASPQELRAHENLVKIWAEHRSMAAIDAHAKAKLENPGIKDSELSAVIHDAFAKYDAETPCPKLLPAV